MFEHTFLPKLGASRGRIYDSFQDTIGGTPLVKVPNLTEKLGLKSTLLLKLECFNPLASVKDRAAIAMIEDAERKGLLSPSKSTIIEASSGNMGIALTAIATARGYKMIVTMPESASIERRKLMQFLGAELILTPAAEGMKGAIAKAQKIAASTAFSWLPEQFKNPANPAIHAASTAEEIYKDSHGKVDAFVAGIGTGGTITGTAKRLKELLPGIKIIGVEPAESPVLEGGEPGPHGIQGIGAGFVPEILDMSVIDKVYSVTTQQALEATRLLATTEGIPLGISSGAALHEAIELAKQEEWNGKTLVAIMPDFAERYISTPLFQE